MTDILRMVLSLSLSGGLLIAVLLLCRPLYRERFSKRWQYYIWLLVLVRLLLPVAPEGNLMALVFQPEEPIRVEQPEGSYDGTPSEQAAPEQADIPAVIQETSLGTRAAENLWIVWIGTAVLLAARKMIIYQRFVRQVRTGWETVSDPSVLERLARLGDRLDLRRPVELHTNPQLSSPMLMGVFRPCIVLPGTAVPEGDLDHILLHELTHYRRRDLLYKWLLQLTLCLHWFNPLVWVMRREVERACELACDEAVLEMLPPQEHRAYGDTLLRSLETGGQGKISAAAVTLTEGGRRMKERLGAIMKYKDRKNLEAVTLIVTVALAGIALAAGAYTRPQAAEDDALWGGGGYFTHAQVCGDEGKETKHKGPYLFAVSWPIDERNHGSEPEVGFMLWDHEKKEIVTLNVYLGEGGRKIQGSGEAEIALYGLLSEMYYDFHAYYGEERIEKCTSFRLDWMDYVGDDGAAALAEKYAKNNWVDLFTAVCDRMNEEEMAELREKLSGNKDWTDLLDNIPAKGSSSTVSIGSTENTDLPTYTEVDSSEVSGGLQGYGEIVYDMPKD